MSYFKPLLLILAVANLLIGMMSGLGRLGWVMPLPETYVHHGAIMVGGFLGSLISLEKAIPLKKPIFYTGPLAGAASIVAFLTGNFTLACVLLILSGAVLVIIYVEYLRPRFDFTLMVALVGAACLMIGNMMLLWKHLYPAVFPWWMGFLLLTIISERLELSKFLPVPANMKSVLKGLLGLYVLTALVPLPFSRSVAGAALILISLWLMRYDMIRIGIRKTELTRYTAIALLCGYIALFSEGVFLLRPIDVSLYYDVTLHTFFLGFVFMMIFAHGPVILPGVLGFSVRPYHAILYVPLAGLLLSLKMRVLADLGCIDLSWRAMSGWVSAGSILLYFLMMAGLTIRGLRNAKAA